MVEWWNGGMVEWHLRGKKSVFASNTYYSQTCSAVPDKIPFDQIFLQTTFAFTRKLSLFALFQEQSQRLLFKTAF